MDINNVILSKCIVHIIGNKGRKEALELSNKELFLDENTINELTQFFLTPFKNINEAHRFFHDIDLNMNEVFICSDNILENENFVKNSINIANHLFNKTKNPSIKRGELFITQLDDIIIDGVVSKSVGIFKSERKDVFFNVERAGDNEIGIEINRGINKAKLDKGCIIVGEDFKNGYKVYVYEYNGVDTEYWRTDFLSITPRNDEYQQTKQFLNEYKDYVINRLPQEIEMTKAEQIDLVNRTVDYFKSNTEFDREVFSQEILESELIIESFDRKINNLEGNFDNFLISKNAVRKQAKSFKSVLKLDKNFHIYIHGNRNLIEQGYDEEKGKRFYKVYFDEEL